MKVLFKEWNLDFDYSFIQKEQFVHVVTSFNDLGPLIELLRLHQVNDLFDDVRLEFGEEWHTLDDLVFECKVLVEVVGLNSCLKFVH